VDIALDPFPYSGGLTTCEALWQGVPVITWPGELPQGRHSASHLTHAGLSDFIAASGREYIALAVRWANDIPALTRLRAGLRDRMAKSNLCDGAKFTSDLEGELRKIWRRRCAAGAV
jgi:predicted O-linked N-acetylglucosamine transferase (SPINDLY family)